MGHSGLRTAPHPLLRGRRRVMRQRILLAVATVVTVAAVFACSLYSTASAFVSREVKRRTGAQKVRVLEGLRAEGWWYGKAEIDPHTGERLLARYEWKRGFARRVALAGRLVSDRPSDCSTCLYRIEVSPHDRRYHPYNYTVYVLNSDLNVLEVYEQFGS